MKPSLSNKPNLVILMPMVWGIRNVVYSGILQRLTQAGVNVHLLLRQYDPVILDRPAYKDFSWAKSCQKMIMPLQKRKFKGRSFLRDVIHSAFGQRNEIGSYDLYQRWYQRNYSPAQERRAKIIDLLGRISQPSVIYSSLNGFCDFLSGLEYDLKPICLQLNDLSPDLIWTTANIDVAYERAYVFAARQLNIPIINSILSFDNLSSKPAHLLYDYYLTWSEGMKKQLLRFYPQVNDQRVIVTGTPQFDFHCRQEFIWSRQKTLSCLGLPDNANYFLYSTKSKELAPSEPELIAKLAQRMQTNNLLKHYWLIVRLHPLEEWARWAHVADGLKNVVISPGWDVTPSADRWAWTTPDDQARLVSSVKHATGCINITSTSTLDAGIMDRPVIGIGFENEPEAPREILYEEYNADHYRPLVQSGGLRLARTWGELLDLMQQAIQNPGRDRSARAQMVTQECGMVDGKSAQRVTDALLECLRRVDG